jgi:uncharacterized protein YutE (UPF0331/DUF86 family)
VREHDYRVLLRDTLGRLDEAVRWLRRSEAICKEIDVTAELKEEEYDALEAFASRFARVSDMVVQRAFRGIDRAELDEPGSVLDVLARAEKRGLIESVEQFRLIREVRNEVAHEYLLQDLGELFQSVKDYTPMLLRSIDKVRAYCEKYGDIDEEAEAGEA